MTTYVTLRCDSEHHEPGGDVGVCCSLLVAPEGADAAAAREFAAALGWSVDARGRDLCGCDRTRPAVGLVFPDAGSDAE